jgi:hypothetical protein
MVTYRPVWITSDIIYNAETDAKNIELIVMFMVEWIRDVYMRRQMAGINEH